MDDLKGGANMRSSNPALQESTFGSYSVINETEQMTVQGTCLKAGILLLLVLLTAGFTWTKFYQAGGNPDAVSGWMMVGLMGGLITAFTTIFKQVWAPYLAPVYALFQGLLIGGLSSMFEVQFPGIVIQATGLTFGTLFAMLFAYQAGLVRATENFKLGVIAATGGIAVVYVGSLILSFFGISVPFIYGNGIASIGFSLFVVVIAALNFVIDFDFIEQGAKRGAPKYMEWYGAFALMITLIWLYIEFLRLLGKARSR